MSSSFSAEHSEKSALMAHSAFGGERFGVTEHGDGDVGKEDAERWADAVDGAEGDEAIASADVGDRHAGGEPGAVKNAIGEAFDPGADNSLVRGIVGVATVEKPFGPHIAFRIDLVEHHA